MAIAMASFVGRAYGAKMYDLMSIYINKAIFCHLFTILIYFFIIIRLKSILVFLG